LGSLGPQRIACKARFPPVTLTCAESSRSLLVQVGRAWTAWAAVPLAHLLGMLGLWPTRIYKADWGGEEDIPSGRDSDYPSLKTLVSSHCTRDSKAGAGIRAVAQSHAFLPPTCPVTHLPRLQGSVQHPHPLHARVFLRRPAPRSPNSGFLSQARPAQLLAPPRRSTHAHFDFLSLPEVGVSSAAKGPWEMWSPIRWRWEMEMWPD
jgi:hypothetical protein